MKKKELNYKEAMAELESILEKMENQDLDVDELSENVKKAATLLKFCQEKLKNTEDEVQKIIDNMK